ncbi:MAG: HAD family hydrolase [Formosimonas sp.]
MFSTLISDCDGVLLDSEVVAFEVLVHEVQTIFPNLDVTAHLHSAFGQKTEELVRQLAVLAGSSIPAGFLQALRQRTDAAIEQRARAIADVAILVNWPQLKAVASNSGTARVRAAVQQVGVLARSDVRVFSADEVAQPKPAPDLYLRVAQCLAVEPAQCLVIEDSLSGVVAAQAAGMTVIGFTGGAHIPPNYAATLRQAGVDAVFERMTDLPEVLRRVAGWTHNNF